MKRRNFLWYSLLFAFGCTAEVNNADNQQKSVQNYPTKLKFAVTDINGLENLQSDFGEFRNTLEEILNIKIEFFPVENPTAAAPALLSGLVDIVFAGPSEYLILNSRAKAIPIIAIQRINYHSIFVVRANSKIKSLSQLKGKTIAMRKIGSTSGHLAPTKLLMDAGLNPKTDVKIVMLDDQGAQALKKGQVDAWATASDRYKNILEKEGLLEKDFSIIFTGPLLPSDVFVVKNQLSPNFIVDIRQRMLDNQEKLLQSILTSKANQKYKGGKFTPADDADYNMIREVYQKIGQGTFL
ncbi:phosphate/phosphite/phosphonate ABC transporter substrate-binding protein [Tolypothrix sp. FACHB-123]|uniref:phosphate/phosphite/phosphonate ABC transporter substrate-binding protein n=1 Tax=Tolypothrix sp. FACHB-123 TaxID=2692868 RepID=UPI0016878DA4|nr:phosphate/phosphite/phosphonate ABC transporter substrate-binding protein [Tolypothrix sp. FACHB-123]MBD2356667.1 phosphate/phosphite/phosphonate ABC transporter substrate-binding protein [Tolypothrix sp. FACHB-123]